MEQALDYEYFIRAAYECGRHGVYSANADVYRRYEKHIQHLASNKVADTNGKPRPWGEPDETLTAKIHKSEGEIYANLKSAIYHIMRKKESKLTDSQYRDLEDLLSNLNAEKNAIDATIEKGRTLFTSIGQKIR